ELGGSQEVTHGRPPRGFEPRGVGRGAGRGGRGVASAGRPAGGPTPAAGRWATPTSASGAGGRRASGGVGPVAPPAGSARRCPHHAARPGNPLTVMGTAPPAAAPPPAL